MSKEKFTKEFIIKYLKDYYVESKKIPLSKDKEHPFSDKTVANKFGSWNNSLILANIPLFRNNPVEVKCKQCNILFKKKVSEIKKNNNHYCTRSCAGTYNNQHRKTGNRISKLEIFLQEHLTGYNFEYNNRNICHGLELDIFISDLKLAFEINGIVHYKSIYGEEKFNKIIKKDKLKMKLCINKGIKLIIIKDESIKFNIKYGEYILNTIYQYIHKNKYQYILKELMN